MTLQHAFCAQLALGPLLCLFGSAHAAITVYDSRSAFEAVVASVGTDTFSDISTTTPTQSPAIRMAGGHGYSVAATDLNTSGATGFYGAGSAGDPALSTTYAPDSIMFASVLGGPTALAGNFFGSNVNGGWQTGSIQLVVTDADGAAQTLLVAPTGTATGSFLGFTSTAAIRSLQVSAVQPTSGALWPTVDNFSLGMAAPVPEPATYASTLAGLVALGAALRRRRKSAQASLLAPLCVASLAGLACTAQAVPVVFTDSAYNTTATALAGAAADVQSASSLALPLPLTSSAVAIHGGDFAGGGAIAAQGLLSTSAEVSNAAGFASATSAAGFVGSFQGGGVFTFQFNYASQNLSAPTPSSDSSLSFMLVSNGGTLLNTLLPATEFFSVSLFIPTGTSNTVSLLLSSEASVTASMLGSAQNTASVAFQVSQVPEPTTWALMFCGLALTAWQARHRRGGSTPSR